MRMTDGKLKKITGVVADTVRNGGKYIWDKDENDIAELLDLVCSLHNELYKEATGEYYDYCFHWANLGYGGNPNDSLFKGEE